jgi:hypothetical protein
MSYDDEANEKMANMMSEQGDYSQINYSLKQSYEKEYSNSMLDFFTSYLNHNEQEEQLKIDLKIKMGQPNLSNRSEQEANVNLDSNNETNASLTYDSNTSWLFNPLAFFRIKNNGAKRTKKEDKPAENSASLAKDAAQLDVTLVEQVDGDQEAKGLIGGSGDELNVTLPLPQVNLDLTKKEIPKSTVETVSPTYKLIKDAFSELQLFSRVCKFLLFFMFFLIFKVNSN